MQNDESFTHTDSLTIIQAMINKAKDQFSENGHLYLLWGWVILICSIGHFLLMNFFALIIEDVLSDITQKIN